MDRQKLKEETTSSKQHLLRRNIKLYFWSHNIEGVSIWLSYYFHWRIQLSRLECRFKVLFKFVTSEFLLAFENRCCYLSRNGRQRGKTICMTTTQWLVAHSHPILFNLTHLPFHALPSIPCVYLVMNCDKYTYRCIEIGWGQFDAAKNAREAKILKKRQAERAREAG